MESALDLYIRRIIDLDKKAVELNEKKGAELQKLMASNRNELKSIDAVLEEATLAAKQKHDGIIETAKHQANEMNEAARLMIERLQNSFSNIKEEAARDIWKQLLDIEG